MFRGLGFRVPHLVRCNLRGRIASGHWFAGACSRADLPVQSLDFGV